MFSPSIIDTRESNATLYRALQAVGWKRDTLQSGDARIDCGPAGAVLIERKTTSDFVNCMKDGSLMRQARRLVEATKWPTLLLEGSLAVTHTGEVYGTGITWEQMWNYLQTLQDLGLRLQITGSTAHTVTRLVELEQYYQKDIHESTQREPSGNLGISTLCQVRGIGPAKAKAILKVFPTLSAISAATPEFLYSIPGISPDLAYRIRVFLTKDWSN